MAGDHPSGMWSSAILYYFQVLFFGISDNCLLTVRTDRYNLDRNFQLFFQERDVSIELFGKFVFTLHFRHIDIPTRHFHIYGFDAFIDFKRKLCCFFAIDFISNASLYCFEAIMISFVTPLIMIAYFSATKSIQPQRRSRPVTAPYSCPI